MLSQYDQNCPQDGPCGLLNGASSTSDGQTWPLNGPNWPFYNLTCFERPKFVFWWPKIASEWPLWTKLGSRRPLLAFKWPKVAPKWPLLVSGWFRWPSDSLDWPPDGPRRSQLSCINTTYETQIPLEAPWILPEKPVVTLDRLLICHNFSGHLNLGTGVFKHTNIRPNHTKMGIFLCALIGA